MKKTSRILSLFLALVLCLGLLPATALGAAAETTYLSNEEMFSSLPSQAPEVIKPENTDQLSYWNRSNWTEQKSLETIFQEIIAQTKSVTSRSKTETEKAEAIFNWVAKNVSYDYTAYKYWLYKYGGANNTLNEEQQTRLYQAASAVHVFYYRRGICAGYAKLASLMLTLAGLPSAYITGTAAGGGLHAWSAVYADGQWILFDATWDKWDISPNFHRRIESIEWGNGLFRMTMAMTGKITCKLMKEYDCPPILTIPDGVTEISTRSFADYKCQRQ